MKMKLHTSRNTLNLKRKHSRRRMSFQTISTKTENQLKQCDITQQTVDGTSCIIQSTSNTKNCYPLNIECNADPTILLIDYSTLCNSMFKELLSGAINTEKDSFAELLHHEETFPLIREPTQLLDKLNYTKLQHDQ